MRTLVRSLLVTTTFSLVGGQAMAYYMPAPQMHFSAPAPQMHYSAPAVHYSAPQVHYTAPRPSFQSRPSHVNTHPVNTRPNYGHSAGVHTAGNTRPVRPIPTNHPNVHPVTFNPSGHQHLHPTSPPRSPTRLAGGLPPRPGYQPPRPVSYNPRGAGFHPRPIPGRALGLAGAVFYIGTHGHDFHWHQHGYYVTSLYDPNNYVWTPDSSYPPFDDGVYDYVPAGDETDDPVETGPVADATGYNFSGQTNAQANVQTNPYSKIEEGIRSRGFVCVVADPTGTPLNVRNAPNGEILGALYNGTYVHSTDNNRRTDNMGQQWLYVVPDQGASGWAFASYVNC
jgi:hypothetical protein